MGERSCAPNHCPHGTADQVVKRVVAERKRQPRWDRKRLPEPLNVPAASNIGEILKDHGLIKRRQRRGAEAKNTDSAQKGKLLPMLPDSFLPILSVAP